MIAIACDHAGIDLKPHVIAVLDELGIPINRFHEYKELPALVQQAMNGKLQRSTDEQRALLPAHYSWDAVHKDWLGLYE